jgi:hypothetical protein
MIKASTTLANLLKNFTIYCVLWLVNLKRLKCDSNLITKNVMQGLPQRGLFRSLVRLVQVNFKRQYSYIYMYFKLTVKGISKDFVNKGDS